MGENTLNKLEQNSSVFKPEIKSEQVFENTAENNLEKSVIENKGEQEGVKSAELNSGKTSNSSLSVSDDYHKRREVQIDAFLSEGLNETFLAMAPDKQKIFKEQGEVTAKKINVLLDATKINVSKIIDLIKKWLKLITGINKFFLDQEAKIKADKIIKIKNRL